MTRTQLQNLIDIAYDRGRITATDAFTAGASMRDPNQATADILATINNALAAKAIIDGTTKAAVDAELAKALGLSQTL
jgi:hypothetical protein